MTATRPYYLLKLFIDSKDNELLNLYAESSKKHNAVVERYLHGELVHVDAGIDLFCPAKLIVEEKNMGKVKTHGCFHINSSINKVKKYFQSIR